MTRYLSNYRILHTSVYSTSTETKRRSEKWPSSTTNQKFAKAITMSRVYSTEPQTSGRVIFETTHGPLEIHLWCRECPATTRYFLQLCLDEFYNKMVFHRIVPGFLIQTGALRHGSQQTPMSKEFDAYRTKMNADEALSRRPYELNSRIRFNHRGQLAMALEVNDDNDSASMQPQFFITLDEANFLDGKHVVFGTVSGPTIFNALRIGQVDVDEETNQPTEISEAPRIERVKIVENEIHTDIVPTENLPWRIVKKEVKKKKKRKGVKNVNVLSFGNEFADEELSGMGGMKSSHDLIESKNLSKFVDEEVAKAIESKEIRSSKQKVKEESRETEHKLVMPEIETVTEKTNIMEQAEEVDIQPPKQETLKHSMQRKEKVKKKLSLVEERRAKYAKGKAKNKRRREEDTMSKLVAFQKKFVKQGGESDSGKKEEDTGYHGQVLEDNEDFGDWMNTKFKCRKHMDVDAKLGGDGRNAMEDYEVIEEKSSDRKRYRHGSHRYRQKR